MMQVALGVLIAIGIVVGVVAFLNAVVMGWILLWHGIDDYGPLKHRWLSMRRRKKTK